MGTRILVVDDYPAVAAMTASMAVMEGYQVLVAHTGREALDKVGTFDPHLVILDLMLGGPPGGEDVLAHMRDAGSRVPVLVLSALVGAGWRPLDRHANVETMAKPFKVRELSARIAAMVRAGASVGDR
jgi:DNA-binding response OmpR family regulator